MQFDGAWTIYLPQGASAPSASQFPTLTNGSIAIVPSVDGSTKSSGIDTSTTVMGSTSGFSRPTFQFARIRASLGSVELDQRMGVTGQRSLALNMQTAVFTLNAQDSVTGCTVRHDLRALLQYPGMVLHSTTVTVPASGGLTSMTLKLLHEVRSPSAGRFRGETIAVGSGGFGGSQFVMSAVNKESACVSVYLPETPLSSAAAYNEMAAAAAPKAWAVLPMNNTSTPGVPTVFTTHVLTVVAPLESSSVTAALKRRLLGILSSASTPALVAQSLITGHEAAWASKWNTYVDVPTGASPYVKWALRYAFYNLHSCLRSAGNPTFVDLAGTTLGSAMKGDDFLVNAMLFVSPGAARALLEEKWRILPMARQVAIGDGLDGARFPYAREPSPLDDYGADDEDDPYPNDPWLDDPASAAWQATPIAIRVYGTLATAVDAWNYFRVSKDIDWLTDRGWDLIRAAADLVCSLAAPMVQPTIPMVLPQAPAIPATGSTCVGVVGMDVNRIPSTGPAAVIAAAVAVMRATVEASYALGYKSPNVPLWNAIRYGLLLKTTSGVVASDATTSGTGPLIIPEPLVALMEPLASLSSSLTNTTPFGNNVNYWTNSANRSTNATPRDVAIGDLVSLQALAKLCQSASSYSSAFSTALDSALSSHGDMGAGFGNLRPAGGPSAAPNDLTLSALLVLTFVQGLGGASVMGGYSANQLSYSPLGMGATASAVLPAAWERLVMYGLGPQQIDIVQLNGSSASGPGSDSFVPWSVNYFV